MKIIDATTLSLIHRLVGVLLGIKGRAAAKLNIRIDQPTRLPESLVVTAGRRHERRTVRRLIDFSQEGVTYIFDWGYFSPALLDRLVETGNYFATLLKDGVTARTVHERKRFAPRRREGFRLLKDSVVELPGEEGRFFVRLVEAFDRQGRPTTSTS